MQLDTMIEGRIDETGKVLLPIIVVASDGFELEIEAVINLNFTGSIVVPEDLCTSFGWRCLGALGLLLYSNFEVAPRIHARRIRYDCNPRANHGTAFFRF